MQALETLWVDGEAGQGWVGALSLAGLTAQGSGRWPRPRPQEGDCRGAKQRTFPGDFHSGVNC